MPCVYKIVNLFNGKIYIGQTTKEDVTLRFDEHVRALIRGDHDNWPMLQDYKFACENYNCSHPIHVFGFQKIYVRDIEYCTFMTGNILNYYEDFYIKQFNSLYPNGYNLQSGGTRNFRPNDVSVQKTADANRGRTMSMEQRQKLSEMRKGSNNPMWHHVFTEAELQHLRETRHKQYGADNHMYGRVGKLHHLSKAVQAVYEDDFGNIIYGEKFECIKQAAAWCGARTNVISRLLNGDERRKHGGHHPTLRRPDGSYVMLSWRFIEEED